MGCGVDSGLVIVVLIVGVVVVELTKPCLRRVLGGGRGDLVAVGGDAAELLVGQPVPFAGRIGHCLGATEVLAHEEIAAGAETAVAVAEDLKPTAFEEVRNNRCCGCGIIKHSCGEDVEAVVVASEIIAVVKMLKLWLWRLFI